MSTDSRPALLYLVHRIPFPPNKGDKLRSHHMLAHFAKHYRVFLGCFIDQPEDWQYVENLRAYCADICVLGITPRLAKLKSLRGLLSGEALTLPYYRHAQMSAWVDRVVKTQAIKRCVVFCSAMAPYVQNMAGMRRVIDFVDVDSAKWTRYADDCAGPMRWLYRREGRRLAAFEAEVAAWADASVLVSPAEAGIFNAVAPQAQARTHAIGNGVNADFFSPDASLVSPYAQGEQAVVFTGAMDYWPNADAAIWFAKEVWPQIHARYPSARFYVVGMKPGADVLALVSASVVVTGTVPDVRPYLQHAQAVVAPLRIARGVQNKILEAMAIARPVVASATCAVGISAHIGDELLTADGAADFVSSVIGLLADPQRAEAIGQRARQRVLSDYSWAAHLARFDALIEGSKA